MRVRGVSGLIVTIFLMVCAITLSSLLIMKTQNFVVEEIKFSQLLVYARCSGSKVIVRIKNVGSVPIEVLKVTVTSEGSPISRNLNEGLNCGEEIDVVFNGNGGNWISGKTYVIIVDYLDRGKISSWSYPFVKS